MGGKLLILPLSPCRSIFIKSDVPLIFGGARLSYDENAILDAIEKVSKSVVNISTVKMEWMG